jgi:hypothetical protein
MLQEVEIGRGIMALMQGQGLKNERMIEVGKVTTKGFLFHASQQFTKKRDVDTHYS